MIASSRLFRSLSVVALLAAAGATAIGAQAVPTVTVNKRTGRSKYSFGHLYAAAALPDGRVVASDSKSNFFRIVDFKRGGDVATLGVQGDDPEMYRTANAVYPVAGDSLLLLDLAGHKFLRVSPSGDVAGTEPLPTMSGRLLALPAGVDAADNVYFVRDSFDMARRAPVPFATIVREPIAGGNLEPVGQLQRFAPGDTNIKGIMPFPARDAWALRPDGLTARVTADTYRVIWSRDGHESGRTAALPYTPVPVDAAEQQAFRDSATAAMQAVATQLSQIMSKDSGGRNVTMLPGGGMRVAMGGAAPDGGAMAGGAVTVTRIGGGDGGGAVFMGGPPGEAPPGAIASGGPAVKPTLPPIGPFPATKPPITAGSTTAMFDAGGMLWIARSRAHDDHVPHYDVVAEGRGLVAHVDLPEGTRIVAFGPGVVYLAHPDGDQDYLERYALPKF